MADTSEDTRYCYSANCTWHGPISEVKGYPVKAVFLGREVSHRLPGCPHCGSPLMEYETRKEWDDQAVKFQAGHPEMPRYIEWLEAVGRRPRCRSMKGWDWKADYAEWVKENPEELMGR